METRQLAVDVIRGTVVESRHRIHGAIQHSVEAPSSAFGDPDAASFWRSALKPFQVMPVLEDGAASAFGFQPDEIAVACGSHGGRAEHTARVRAMLEKIGLDADSLHCGPHRPYDRETAADLNCAGLEPDRTHNNCSGKHAALLALAVHRGWDVDGYWRFDHPVQRRVRDALARWISASPDSLRWEIDGCGLPTPYLSLRDMALAYARLASSVAAGELAPTAVVAAMMEHPELTSSPGREPLRIMEAAPGRLLAKEGAEGVLCIACPGDGWGVALKVEDGTRRAVGPAAVALLDAGGWLGAEESTLLADLGAPPILSTRGAEIGVIRAAWIEADRSRAPA